MTSRVYTLHFCGEPAKFIHETFTEKDNVEINTINTVTSLTWICKEHYQKGDRAVELSDKTCSIGIR